MRAALHSNFSFAIKDVPPDILHEFQNEPRYIWVKLPEPFHQGGQGFLWIVAPFKLIDGKKFEQSGAGVLCQTEDETKETFNNLVERSKKHAVIVQWPGFGQVAWTTNLRRFSNEIGVLFKNLPDGKQLWVAFERDRSRHAGGKGDSSP